VWVVVKIEGLPEIMNHALAWGGNLAEGSIGVIFSEGASPLGLGKSTADTLCAELNNQIESVSVRYELA
jgi:hypothetical protein